MIKEVSYARLYPLPDNKYENERFEATAIVQDGDVDAAFDEARHQVEEQHMRAVADRQPKVRAKQSNYIQPLPQPDVLPAPATPKQRNYIAALQDDLMWTSEQLAVYANEQDIDLVAMTMRQASDLINSMKRLNEERRSSPIVADGDLPF